MFNYVFSFVLNFLKYCGFLHIFLIYLKPIRSCLSRFSHSTACLHPPRSVHIQPLVSRPAGGTSTCLTCCFLHVYFTVQLQVTSQFSHSCFPDLERDEALHPLTVMEGTGVPGREGEVKDRSAWVWKLRSPPALG